MDPVTGLPGAFRCVPCLHSSSRLQGVSLESPGSLCVGPGTQRSQISSISRVSRFCVMNLFFMQRFISESKSLVK